MLQCRDGTYYTGITNHLAKRIATHQAGKGAKYTRGRLPLELVYFEIVADKSAALKREIILRKKNRQEKLQLIQEYNNN